jgi:hypothetical protein
VVVVVVVLAFQLLICCSCLCCFKFNILYPSSMSFDKIL